MFSKLERLSLCHPEAGYVYFNILFHRLYLPMRLFVPVQLVLIYVVIFLLGYVAGGHLCHEIIYLFNCIYVAGLIQAGCFLPQGEYDMILLFLMYGLLCSLFFHNYVILCLFSGEGGLVLLSFNRVKGPSCY